MKKIYYLALFFLLVSGTLKGQRFGNEWIVYGQPYLKMSVTTSGIYRITKANLDGALFDVAGKNVNNFQVFHRGKEIAVNLVDLNTIGSFETGDYIEFYAINNDGFQDSELYLENHTRANIYSSIYSDETAYFLTVSTGQIGKRMTEGPSADGGLTTDPYYMASILTLPKGTTVVTLQEHSQDAGLPSSPLDQQAYFEPHEGLTGKLINTSSNYSLSIPLPDYQSSHGTNHTTVDGLVQSRMPNSKTLSFSVGGNSGNIPLSSLDTAPFSTTIPVLTSPLTLTIDWVPTPVSTDLFSVSYHNIIYPKNLIYTADNEYVLLPNTSGNVNRLTFNSAPTLGYDITDFENQKKITISGNDVYVGNTNNTARKIYLATSNKAPASSIIAQVALNILAHPAFKKITFTKIVQTDYDYILLTDPSLRPAADDYANYRKSPAGGNYKVLVKEVRGPVLPSIYEEFCYGERNPIAIKRFADYMTEEGGNPKALFLCGNSYSFVDGLKVATREGQDLVTTFGYPGSDILLTSGIQRPDNSFKSSFNVPLIPTGRLAAISQADVTNYLTKVTAFEAQTDLTWQKNIIHFTGAKHTGENISMKAKMDAMDVISSASTFGFNTQNFYEKAGVDEATFGPDVNANADLVTKLNSGVSILNYLGHGNYLLMSNNLGFLTASGANAASVLPYASISPKFPFLMANGCGVGNSFQSLRDCIVSNWVKNPTKGAIAAYSQSFYSYEDVDFKYMELFYKTYLGNQTNVLGANKVAKPDATNYLFGKPIGVITRQTNKNYESVNAAVMLTDPRLAANLEQGILHADPAIIVFRGNSGLPVKLIDFDAKNFENKVKLNWKTESEVNFAGFEVERSSDLRRFSKIGFVGAIGNENEIREYDFIDQTPIDGVNYYRLKLIENDGSVSFSKPVSVSFIDEAVGKLLLLGNPIQGNSINFILKDASIQTAELFDLNGNHIEFGIAEDADGSHKIKLKSTLSKGEFIFSIKNKNGKLFTQKVIIN